MTVQDNNTVIQDTFLSFNLHDLAPAAAFAGDDLEWTDVPSGTVYRGREGYQDFLKAWFTAFPDVNAVIQNLVVTEDTVTVDYIITGTNSGPLTGHFGQGEPTGRRLNMPFRNEYDIRNSRIVSGRCKYDQGTLMSQLGQKPKAMQAGA